MRTLKIIMIYFSLAHIFIMCRGAGLSYDKPDTDFNTPGSPVELPEPGSFIELVDCFEHAEAATGFPAEILRGIAAIESCFKVKAVGDGGLSLGMFQLHSRWHESRVEKWGEFDPADPFESAVIAGRIMRENLIAFDGDLTMAVAAYRQGVAGVKRNGVTDGYVYAVLNWRMDSGKLESFTLFEEDRSKDRR
jgi:soluble lytic murein transglycosylase-like protein